ncbi:MAG TPA: G1 family glutamic endopeptidase [Solirubrobacteraceae bacterium]|nr:G1 family glutamic endopeptidase [Solirubrobacteraceae bacterium]
MRRLTVASLLSSCIALSAAPVAIGHVVQHLPRHKLGTGQSTNWSGYSVDGTNATAVTGSWTVQPATCAKRESSWSSPWVGIDGDISSTVEQTGTDTDCSHGTPSYYAWYEMYPKSLVVINHTVSPGDAMTGSVSYDSSGFLLSLSDNTRGWSFSIIQTSTSAARNSVEWIVEGPSNGALTDFGTLNFSADSATISGQTQTLDGFGSSANAITMVGKGGVVRAAPGAVGVKGAFTDTWFHS